MSCPVLANELILLLRRPWLFLALGIVFLSLTLFAMVLSQAVLLSLDRNAVCRNLFYVLLAAGYVGFSFHAGRVAAQSTGKERDRDTSVFLRSAPLRAWSVILQKAGMSLIVEWFVFIGLLPFISLLFLIGGLGGKEFLYQLVNLVVWMNTCVLIGLVVGLRTRNAGAADRAALGVLINLAAIPVFLEILLGLRKYIPLGGLWNLFFDWMVGLFQFLSTLSPFWMSGSWMMASNPAAIPTSFDSSYFFFVFPIRNTASAPYLQIFPQSPALFAWLLHLGLQGLLFLIAVRRWNRVGTETAAPQKEPTSTPSIRRKLHGEGWRAFFRQERNQSFATPRGTWIYLLIFILAGALAGTYSTGVELPVVTALFLIASNVGTLFLAQSAYGREIRRKTAPFLLVAPAPAQTISLGKWLFYQAVGFGALLPGFAYTAALIYRAEYYSLPNSGIYWIHLSYYLVGAAALPMTSMMGIVLGLNTFPIYYAVPLGLAAVCLWPVAILAFVIWLFQQLVIEESREAEIEEGIRKPTRSRLVFLAFLAVFALIVGLAVGLGPNDSALREAIGVTLLILNSAVILPAVGTALWIWLSRQPETWWREKLLPPDTPQGPWGRSDPFFGGQERRYSRYRARVLAMAAQSGKSVSK